MLLKLRLNFIGILRLAARPEIMMVADKLNYKDRQNTKDTPALHQLIIIHNVCYLQFMPDATGRLQTLWQMHICDYSANAICCAASLKDPFLVRACNALFFCLASRTMISRPCWRNASFMMAVNV